MVITTSVLCLLLAAIKGITAFQPAVIVSPELMNRDLITGGWASQTIQSTCPPDSINGGNGGCCPRTLVHVPTGVDPLCCPPGMTEHDCFDFFSHHPTCANPIWTLWNTTNSGEFNGFFCCEADWIGDINGYCHTVSEKLPADLQGIIVTTTAFTMTSASATTSMVTTTSTIVTTNTAITTSSPNTTLSRAVTTAAGSTSSLTISTTAATHTPSSASFSGPNVMTSMILVIALVFATCL